MLSEECELVTLMSVIKGRFELTTLHLYFFDSRPIRDGEERFDYRWPVNSLKVSRDDVARDFYLTSDKGDSFPKIRIVLSQQFASVLKVFRLYNFRKCQPGGGRLYNMSLFVILI